MGWLTDPLFGERKRIDQNKVNSFMAPYDKMLDEQEAFARQAMDPYSPRNMEMRNQLRAQNFDLTSAQNQGLMSAAAMGNMSPGQTAMQAQANNARSRGQFGQQMSGLLSSQFSQGMNMFGNVMQGRQQQGERHANAYIQQINASNEARQSNINMVKDLAMAAVGAAGTAMSGSG